MCAFIPCNLVNWNFSKETYHLHIVCVQLQDGLTDHMMMDLVPDAMGSVTLDMPPPGRSQSYNIVNTHRQENLDNLSNFNVFAGATFHGCNFTFNINKP